MKIFLLLGLFLFISCKTTVNVLENKDTCLTKCDAAGDERKNTDKIHDIMGDEDKMKNMMADSGLIVFPLRIGLVQSEFGDTVTTQESIRETINILNKAFRKASINFSLAYVDTIISPLNISLLQSNYYEAYDAFSAQHDLKDTISLFLFDYDPYLCKTRDNVISCGRTGGFSYILSERTNNVVLSKFDLKDHKIVVHEFGHFFGLYHTFEEFQYGKELASGENCAEAGDRICDTPADPGTLYEVYVNYSRCEMIGNQDAETSEFYTPLINNYMSYYKPCYLKEYEFTPMQLKEIRVAAMSELRSKFMVGR